MQISHKITNIHPLFLARDFRIQNTQCDPHDYYGCCRKVSMVVVVVVFLSHRLGCTGIAEAEAAQL
jgi:hypothetical protein